MASDSLGRNVLIKNNLRKSKGFIILTYPCRALEWLNLRKLYAQCLEEFGQGQLVSVLDDIMFAWKYHTNLSMKFYRPAVVFRDFSFSQLLGDSNHCICQTSKRLAKFRDTRTLDETSSFAKPQIHVRTVDVNIVHHKGLRQALVMGLNHVPLKPTSNFAVSIATALDGFEQLVQIMNLETVDFPLKDAIEWLRTTCLGQLKTCSKVNKYAR
jgi:hypothetical protein